MELKEPIKDVARRAREAKYTAQTEEATKNGVILPFVRALGFDVFDLSQVVPEYVADIGVKKGEKVDYALKIDGSVSMLIEAKSITSDLSGAQFNQLYRYFNATDAKIAILTNGSEVWFFSDIDEPNRMDGNPFFRFHLENYNDEDLRELEKFHKDNFSVEKILETAALLKYTNAAARFIENQRQDPDEDFIKVVARAIYDGNITKSVIDQMRHPIKVGFNKVINDQIKQRFEAAFSDSSSSELAKPEEIDTAGAERVSEIETTDEEWKAFRIVQAISSEIVDPERVFIRDAKSYCAILFDDNNRQPICRLHFNAKSVKYVGLFDEEKAETREAVQTPSDIFSFKERIRQTLRNYDS